MWAGHKRMNCLFLFFSRNKQIPYKRSMKAAAGHSSQGDYLYQTKICFPFSIRHTITVLGQQVDIM